MSTTPQVHAHLVQSCAKSPASNGGLAGNCEGNSAIGFRRTRASEEPTSAALHGSEKGFSRARFQGVGEKSTVDSFDLGFSLFTPSSESVSWRLASQFTPALDTCTDLLSHLSIHPAISVCI